MEAENPVRIIEKLLTEGGCEVDHESFDKAAEQLERTGQPSKLPPANDIETARGIERFLAKHQI
jgi:hypothetical protein